MIAAIELIQVFLWSPEGFFYDMWAILEYLGEKSLLFSYLHLLYSYYYFRNKIISKWDKARGVLKREKERKEI